MSSTRAPRTGSGLLRGIDIEFAYDFSKQSGPFRVLICCESSDQEVKKVIQTHLQPLETAGKLKLWSRDATPAGGYWKEELRTELLRAEVAIVLISADLLSSELFVKLEKPTLSHRQRRGDLRIVPLLVRPCMWETDDWLQAIQMLPPSGKPVSSLQKHEAEDALLEVAKLINTIITEGPRSALDASTYFELYGRVRHLLDAKNAEAKYTIAAMARGLAQFAMREDEYGRPVASFPPSAPVTPPQILHGTKAAVEEHDWNHATWRAIKFCLPGVVYFSYEIVTSSDFRTATVRAHGDLEGNGKVVIHEKLVRIDDAGHVEISPETVTRERFGS